jgi:4-hydroxy-tetrahydrodipicolinate reductase
MSQPIRILLNGAKGRMGLAIANVAGSEKAVIAAGVDQGDDIAAHIGAADVVIDFSFHSATLAVAQLCARHKKPLVIGTTGHTAEEKAAITAAIQGLPVVWAGNYSVGVTLLNALVRQAARSLADAGRWDVEVLEMHHRLKKDAPSGTAETLLKILLEERKLAKDARSMRSACTPSAAATSWATTRFSSPPKANASNSRTRLPTARSSRVAPSAPPAG